ncbi:MAG: hypothetical protein R6X34_30220 [Chloroflexota bacterium]
MEKNTYTYTARSMQEPHKTATFTLQNGSVSVQLDNAMLAEMVNADETAQTTGGNVADVAKATAVEITQKMLRSLPIHDFEADLKGSDLHTTIWVRPGGLRAAPVSITWNEVVNPQAARTFVKEVGKRKKTAPKISSMPSILDYWFTWVLAGVIGVVLVVVLTRLLKRTMS